MIPNYTINSTDSERMHLLAQLDLDYSAIQTTFSNITELAAKISGCRISLLNFIDQNTQWSVASYGMDIHQTSRQDTICKFTLEGEKYDFEVLDLSDHSHFNNLQFIRSNPELKYYYGIPFYFDKRVALGTLCVMDNVSKPLSDEKKNLLKLVVKEIEERLLLLFNVSDLEEQLTQVERKKTKLAHDIRGPLGGIISLSEVVKSEGLKNSPEEMLEYFDAIHHSSSTMIELATDILTKNIKNGSTSKDKRLFDLYTLKEKVNQLYAPAALAKSIEFEVEVNDLNSEKKFPKTKLLQILGNLVSNSIKFTPAFGRIKVNLAITAKEHANLLRISIEDSGIGMDTMQIASIGRGESSSNLGTGSEHGFGLGLNFVRELIDQLNGEFHIDSDLGVGTTIKISIPFT
ncbi:Signal transduction histidine kinase [Algoriphagus locisalis]|uniref:histidine kinase n=1 Tax=Algoriphagus locisalis TaxID=305507 RepID=A0A1I6XCJ8_9BACT|nr:GAF domain-containing sensor histidine kinase [Algoriphagus locisalis]SFT35841.1 Signal transduction histidine kinase [Algoriphagus locisalis]